MRLTIALLVFGFSQVTLASGWNCRDTDSSYPRAKLMNSTTNPRVPAVFVVSTRNGTVFTAKNSEISKKNLSNGVRYSANGDEFSAVLFVQYREGSDRPLEDGDVVYGKLIINDEEGKSTFDMDCARYLKN